MFLFICNSSFSIRKIVPVWYVNCKNLGISMFTEKSHKKCTTSQVREAALTTGTTLHTQWAHTMRLGLDVCHALGKDLMYVFLKRTGLYG